MKPKRVPYVMGVLNVTPDSFSDGGHHFNAETAVSRALQMADEGADIIDIGGESSRPGADGVDADEELGRVMPVIEALTGKLSTPMSIDTRRAHVAHTAIEAGCRIVNDITACRDPEMIGVVKQADVPIVIMHMKGDPKTMQFEPHYENVTKEVGEFLSERAEFLKREGVDSDKIIIDPGIGFGKRLIDNLELIGSLDSLRRIGYPLLIGASRKTFLGTLLDSEPEDRIAGSLAVATCCQRFGVDIIRVHDVKETVGLFRVLDAIEHPGDYQADR